MSVTSLFYNLEIDKGIRFSCVTIQGEFDDPLEAIYTVDVTDKSPLFLQDDSDKIALEIALNWLLNLLKTSEKTRNRNYKITIEQARLSLTIEREKESEE